MAKLHVKPGGTWTSEAVGNGCQIQTFAAGGKKITTTDTAGNDTTLVFSGSYVKAKKRYTGTFNARDSITATGQLVKGAVSTWHGHTC